MFARETFIEAMRERASLSPNRNAYTFLNDGEADETSITYSQLDAEARKIGVLLQEYGYSGERVLLVYPPGIRYIAAFMGCLYAGATAVPVYPPRQNKSPGRIQAIIHDARPTAALTETAVLQKMGDGAAKLATIHWLNTDGLDSLEGVSDGWKPKNAAGDSLAFLQYTSGSTGTPKGVMLTHRNLLSNMELIHKQFAITPEDVAIGWLPPYHDMGLIGNLLTSFYSGIQLVFFSPMDFLQKPVRWLQAIAHYKGTLSGGPNFAYQLCADKITPEQAASLDLSSWRLAFVGAEPIRTGTLNDFQRAFQSQGFRRSCFYGCYGLAEAALFATGGPVSTEPQLLRIDSRSLEEHRVRQSAGDVPSSELVSSGTVPPELQLRIVDPVSKSLCQPHQVGEIWIKGPSVAAGYWNHASGSQETFGNELNASGPYMRTGDLGFVWNNHLFVTGRIKDLIIVNGKNVYPTDLEETAGSSHEAVQPDSCAAFSIDLGDGEAIVLVCELKRKFLRTSNKKEIAETIRQQVQTTHELALHDVVLIKPVSMPKTSSGKIQRFLCREQYMAGTLDTVFVWSNEYITAIAAEETAASEASAPSTIASAETVEAQLVKNMIVLHVARELRLGAEQVGIDEPLTGMGIDSLKMMLMAADLEEQLKLTLTPDLFYDYPTIRSLSEKIGVMLRDNREGHRTSSASDELTIPDGHYRIEFFPEYGALKEQLDELSRSRVANPYFIAHDAVITGTTRISGRELISFSSYNYLGLSGHPNVSEKAKEAIDRFGTSVSASRIASGEKPFHRRLEQAIADMIGTDDSLVFVGGHSTNESTIGHLMRKQDMIVVDAYCHNSIIQGANL